MIKDRVGYRIKKRRAVAALIAVVPFGYLGVSAVQAQMMMRTPNFNIETRVPSVTPNVASRVTPNIVGRGATGNIAGRATGVGAGSLAVTGAGRTTSTVTATGVGRTTPNVTTTTAVGRNTPNIATTTSVGRTTPNITSTTVTAIRPTITPAITPGITPSITPTVTARVTPTITPIVPRVPLLRPVLPYVHYSPNLYPECNYAYRDSSGECRDKPVSIADRNGGGNGNGPPRKSQNAGGPRGAPARAAIAPRYVTNEVVAEIDAALSVAQTDELARRHRLQRIGSQNFPLIGSTVGLFRFNDRRSVEAVRTELGAEPGVRSTQPNFRYLLSDQKTVPAEGDPAQYALAKLRLPEAHALSRGANVTVAVIDSGIDVRHPELADTIAGSFDALGSKEGPHVHGTGIAGVIVSHARLMGSAPSAKILAIRAFGAGSNGAESTSFVVLKSLQYAASHGAQVVNMSFAGPNDPLIGRGIAAVAEKGIVMVAASGNAGPKSPPLYPAANAGVIAVTATDAYDRLFPASNRGSHIAISAPGVDIFLPAPDDKYQMTSGTSFSAAYISGLAALMMERNRQIKPDELRAILMKTARDLGTPGRDDLFGAGEADAFGAVTAVVDAVVPVASAAPVAEKVSDATAGPAKRSLDQPAPAIASDKSDAQ